MASLQWPLLYIHWDECHMGAGQGSNFYMQLKYRLKNTNILYFKKTRFVWHKNNSFVQFIYKIWIRQRFFIILICLKIKCSFRFNVCDFVNDFVASLKCYWSVVMWFCFSLIQSTIVFCHTNQCDISCAIQHKFFNKFNVVKLFRLKKLQLQIKRVHIFNSHRFIVTVSGLI